MLGSRSKKQEHQQQHSSSRSRQVRASQAPSVLARCLTFCLLTASVKRGWEPRAQRHMYLHQQKSRGGSGGEWRCCGCAEDGRDSTSEMLATGKMSTTMRGGGATTMGFGELECGRERRGEARRQKDDDQPV